MSEESGPVPKNKKRCAEHEFEDVVDRIVHPSKSFGEKDLGFLVATILTTPICRNCGYEGVEDRGEAQPPTEEDVLGYYKSKGESTPSSVLKALGKRRKEAKKPEAKKEDPEKEKTKKWWELSATYQGMQAWGEDDVSRPHHIVAGLLADKEKVDPSKNLRAFAEVVAKNSDKLDGVKPEDIETMTKGLFSGRIESVTHGIAQLGSHWDFKVAGGKMYFMRKGALAFCFFQWVGAPIDEFWPKDDNGDLPKGVTIDEEEPMARSTKKDKDEPAPTPKPKAKTEEKLRSSGVPLDLTIRPEPKKESALERELKGVEAEPPTKRGKTSLRELGIGMPMSGIIARSVSPNKVLEYEPRIYKTDKEGIVINIPLPTIRADFEEEIKMSELTIFPVLIDGEMPVKVTNISHSGLAVHARIVDGTVELVVGPARRLTLKK